MTYDDTLAIMSVLKAAYPSFYRDMKRSEAERTVALWHEMFVEDDAMLVAAAVKAHIASDRKGYPPHIGAIKDAIVKLQAPKEMTEQEAWALVGKATRNGIWGAKEEFEKLPALIRRIVGSPEQLKEWAVMDSDVLQSVVASNFQRSYKAISAQERDRKTLPSSVSAVIGQLSSAFEMKKLTDGG